MKERFIPTQIADGLTPRATTPRLDRGVMNMQESGSGEIAQSTGRVRLSEEALRTQWGRTTQGRDVSPEERSTIEMLIREGIAPVIGATDDIDVTQYADAGLQNVVSEYNTQAARRRAAGQNLDTRFILDQSERVRGLLDSGRVDRTQALRLLDEINEAFVHENPPRAPRREGLWQDLKEADFERLDAGEIEDWLNLKFDTLYVTSQGKDPAQMPYFERMQRAYGEAVRYLEDKPQEIRRLSDLFETRIRLIIMNSAIGTKDLERSVSGAAAQLGAHGILNGTGLDERRVGAMFYRMTDLLEDLRLNKGDIGEGYGGDRQHVSPDMVRRLPDRVINEQIALAVVGVGQFKEDYEQLAGDPDRESKMRAVVTRSVQSAMDILVSTQRLAVIAARGKNLFGADAYFSDPGSTFNMFNFEAYTSEKFDMFNLEDEAFMKLMRDGMVKDYIDGKKEAYEKTLAEAHGGHGGGHEDPHATDRKIADAKWGYDQALAMTDEEREGLGRRLIRDLGVVPDFFSSGWRIKGMTDQLDRYFIYALNAQTIEEKAEAKEKASHFGLFLRLKAPIGDREATWHKIAEHRPEEMIRLLHERLDEHTHAEMTSEIFGPGSNYDQFKAKFGAVIQALREKGLGNKIQDPHYPNDPTKQIIVPEWVNFTALSIDQKEMVNRALGSGAADTLEQTVGNMKRYITDKNVIRTLSNHQRFNDIYNRAINVDDAMLDVLENPPEDSNMIPLSKTWSSEPGGDGLVRNINDIKAAKAHIDNLITFVKAADMEPKLKAAEESAAQAANYGGRITQANILRHTMITFMEASILPEVMDAIGIQKLPFRIPMTAIERIYGPHGKPMSQEERRKTLDKMGFLLKGAAEKAEQEIQINLESELRKVDIDPDLNAVEKAAKKAKLIGEAEHKKHEEHLKAEKVYFTAENRLRVRVRDIVRRKAYSLLLSLFLIAAEAVVGFGNEVVGSGGGGGKRGGGH